MCGFLSAKDAGKESLHFHEMVHVLQGQHLGPDRFIAAYAAGYLLAGGYRQNPLEVMAYDLQGQFDAGFELFDVAAEVGRRLADHLSPHHATNP